MLPEIIYFLPNQNKNTFTVYSFHKDFITRARFMEIPSPVLWTYIYEYNNTIHFIPFCTSDNLISLVYHYMLHNNILNFTLIIETVMSTHY